MSGWCLVLVGVGGGEAGVEEEVEDVAQGFGGEGFFDLDIFVGRARRAVLEEVVEARELVGLGLEAELVEGVGGEESDGFAQEALAPGAFPTPQSCGQLPLGRGAAGGGGWGGVLGMGAAGWGVEAGTPQSCGQLPVGRGAAGEGVLSVRSYELGVMSVKCLVLSVECLVLSVKS